MPADEEEYELLPHEEVERLRHDVDRLKKNPFGEGKDSQDLLTSINDLKNSIQTLHALFAQANQEMVHDYRATSIKDHFKILSEQNAHIAEGIVSVAKLLEKQMGLLEQFQQPMQEQEQPSFQNFPVSSREEQPASTTPQPPPMPPQSPTMQQPLQQRTTAPPQDSFEQPPMPSPQQPLMSRPNHSSNQYPSTSFNHQQQAYTNQERAAQETEQMMGSSYNPQPPFEPQADPSRIPTEDQLNNPPPLPPPPKKRGLFK